MRWARAAVVAALLTCLAGCVPAETDRYAPRTRSATFSPTACAPALGQIADVAGDADVGDALLRNDRRPIAALICSYRGPFGPASRRGRDLAVHRELGGEAATELAAAAAQVSVAKLPPGPTSCPADFGTTTVIVFSYAASPPVRLWWLTSGCQTLDNGIVRASVLANPSFGRFQDAFARLIRAGGMPWKLPPGRKCP